MGEDPGPEGEGSGNTPDLPDFPLVQVERFQSNRTATVYEGR